MSKTEFKEYLADAGLGISTIGRIDQLMFIDEIDCTDLFPEDDSRNRIMVFSTITPGNS